LKKADPRAYRPHVGPAPHPMTSDDGWPSATFQTETPPAKTPEIDKAQLCFPSANSVVPCCVRPDATHRQATGRRGARSGYVDEFSPCRHRDAHAGGDARCALSDLLKNTIRCSTAGSANIHESAFKATPKGHDRFHYGQIFVSLWPGFERVARRGFAGSGIVSRR